MNLCIFIFLIDLVESIGVLLLVVLVLFVLNGFVGSRLSSVSGLLFSL
jgi:hypothetical protein